MAAGRHPSDDVLLALDAGEAAGLRALRLHLERCVSCGTRLVEVRRVRALLRETAYREAAPERDLVFGAVRRLHHRHTAISNVNEFFGALFALVRGLRTLLTIEEAPPGGPHG